MFRKLLKYDLRAIFKYWWIAALSSVGCALTAGFLYNIVEVEHTQYESLQILAGIGVVFCWIGIIFFPLVSLILMLLRVYKHFFTDEGYLTFTLPVAKYQLLNSKVLMALIVNVATVLTMIVDVLIFLMTGFTEDFFSAETWRAIGEMWQQLCEALEQVGAGYLTSYIFEYLLVILAVSIISILVYILCITVGAIIAKKHKILAAIALYYGINSFMSGAVRFVMMEGRLYTLFMKLGDLGMDDLKWALAVIGLAVLGIVVLVGCGIYMLECWMLDRKLNLQ